jgi:hypothetical protein
MHQNSHSLSLTIVERAAVVEEVEALAPAGAEVQELPPPDDIMLLMLMRLQLMLQDTKQEMAQLLLLKALKQEDTMALNHGIEIIIVTKAEAAEPETCLISQDQKKLSLSLSEAWVRLHASSSEKLKEIQEELKDSREKSTERSYVQFKKPLKQLVRAPMVFQLVPKSEKPWEVSLEVSFMVS